MNYEPCFTQQNGSFIPLTSGFPDLFVILIGVEISFNIRCILVQRSIFKRIFSACKNTCLTEQSSTTNNCSPKDHESLWSTQRIMYHINGKWCTSRRTHRGIVVSILACARQFPNIKRHTFSMLE